MNDLQFVHFGVEACLAGLILLLLRRCRGAGQRIIALEAFTGLLRARLEGDAAAMHLRLLQTEKALPVPEASHRGAARRNRAPDARSRSGRGPHALDPVDLTPAQKELWLKIRQLSGRLS